MDITRTELSGVTLVRDFRYGRESFRKQYLVHGPATASDVDTYLRSDKGKLPSTYQDVPLERWEIESMVHARWRVTAIYSRPIEG